MAEADRTGGASPGARLARGAAIGGVLGLWLGLADASRILWLAPRLAGPFADRLGTLLLAMGIALMAGAVLGGIAAGLLSLLRRRAAPALGGRTFPVVACAAGAALVAAIAVAGLGWVAPQSSQGTRPNLLFISIDTLRADHLGAYGYPRDTSPNIDALAEQGVRFLNVQANSSWTLPAHASMFTGLDPFAHGAIAHEDKLAKRFDTLAELLRAAGYTTLAWVGTNRHGFMGARHDIDQGFALYHHHPHPVRFGSSMIARFSERVARLLYPWLGSGAGQVDAAIAWLGGQRSEPFFLFLHLYDVHSKFAGLPYRAPAPFFDRFCEVDLTGYTGCDAGRCASDRLLSIGRGDLPPVDEAELEKLRCLYDGGIAYVDHHLGRLLTALDELGLDDRTIVVLTADHGEAFLEHGHALHSTLHEEVTRIPLIVRMPGGVAGKQAGGLVSQVDLLPTLLELMDVPSRQPVQGRSFAAVLRSWPATLETSVIATAPNAASVSLRHDGYAYIEQTPSAESYALGPSLLYELGRDGEQRVNVAASRPDVREAMRRELEARRAEGDALFEQILGDAPRRRVELSDREREQLRALGYATDEGR